MKFTDGCWRLRPGVRATYARQAYEVSTTERGFTVIATTIPIATRLDTIDHPTLTLECSSPLADVIRVRISHFTGERPRPPLFEIADAEPAVSVTDDEAAVTLTSGALAVRIPKDGEWRVDFLGDGRPLTGSERNGTAAFETDAGHFVGEQLSLGVGETVYGLGERFGPFVKNGQGVEIWNDDGATSSDLAYKNVPFYLTSAGYGVLVNDPGRVSFEVASERTQRVLFSAPGQSLEYFVIYGPSPKDVLRKYAALTGRPALPPAWSFGLWLSTSFLTDYDEATVASLLDGMAERGIPLSVFHFDCFWMRGLHWVDLTWDARTFPDPAAMLARLHDRGVRVCLWINPYVAQASTLFAEAAERGLLVRRPNGDVWQSDAWQAGMGVVDFTNPDAREWFAGRLRELLDMGVDAFKTDFGERIPTDVVWHDGSDPDRLHNYFSLLYNRTVWEAIREARGDGEAVVFARSGTAGSQQYPVHWGGDSESTFPSMAETLRGGLSLALSGYGFWSHDIGGFMGRDIGGVETPDPAVYKRWVAFGLLSSHSRLHGSGSHRVPWLFDHEAVDVLREFTRLKCRLMPYLFGAAVEAARDGVPVLRPMVLEFPDDPACRTLDRQYMLGPSLLVAPVFDAEGDVEYYLPAGRWTKLLTGEVVEGPGWRRERHGFLSLPLLVRPGTLLPLGAHDDRPDYDFADGVTIRAFELADGEEARAEVPTIAGEPDVSFVAQREGGRLTIVRQGRAVPWRAGAGVAGQEAEAAEHWATLVVDLP